MENEKPKEETKVEAKQEAKPEQTPTMVEGAYAAAEKLRAENEKMEANIKKLEELKAFETLGGKSEGAPQEKPVEVESDEAYADKALRGDIKEE